MGTTRHTANPDTPESLKLMIDRAAQARSPLWVSRDLYEALRALAPVAAVNAFADGTLRALTDVNVHIDDKLPGLEYEVGR
jgi:hypothetical protein